MSKNGDIYLGTLGSEQLLSPMGRTYGVKLVEIGREARTASGRLVKDITAVKRQFKLSYSYLDLTELEKLVGIYEIADELSFIHYTADEPVETTTTPEPGAYYESFTVLMEPIDWQRVLRDLMSGVDVVLNEV